MLFDPLVDPSRVYYGTDTRGGGLLVGVALAFLWPAGRLRPACPRAARPCWTSSASPRSAAWRR